MQKSKPSVDVPPTLTACQLNQSLRGIIFEKAERRNCIHSLRLLASASVFYPRALALAPTQQFHLRISYMPLTLTESIRASGALGQSKTSQARPERRFVAQALEVKAAKFFDALALKKAPPAILSTITLWFPFKYYHPECLPRPHSGLRIHLQIQIRTRTVDSNSPTCKLTPHYDLLHGAQTSRASDWSFVYCSIEFKR